MYCVPRPCSYACDVVMAMKIHFYKPSPRDTPGRRQGKWRYKRGRFVNPLRQLTNADKDEENLVHSSQDFVRHIREFKTRSFAIIH